MLKVDLNLTQLMELIIKCSNFNLTQVMLKCGSNQNQIWRKGKEKILFKNVFCKIR